MGAQAKDLPQIFRFIRFFTLWFSGNKTKLFATIRIPQFDKKNMLGEGPPAQWHLARAFEAAPRRPPVAPLPSIEEMCGVEIVRS